MSIEPLSKHIEFFGPAGVGKSTLYNRLRRSASELMFVEDAMKAYLQAKCQGSITASMLALRSILPFVTRSRFFQNAALSSYRPLLLQDFATTYPVAFEAHLDAIKRTNSSAVEIMHALSMFRNSYVNYMVGVSVGDVVVHDELFLQRAIRLLSQKDFRLARFDEVLPSQILPFLAVHVIDDPISIVKKVHARQLRGRTNFHHQHKSDCSLLESVQNEVAFFGELAQTMRKSGVEVLNIDLRSGNVDYSLLKAKISNLGERPENLPFPV